MCIRDSHVAVQITERHLRLDHPELGGVEHAGYGLGFERMIMYLTGIQNIRDVLPFPRTAYGF